MLDSTEHKTHSGSLQAPPSRLTDDALYDLIVSELWRDARPLGLTHEATLEKVEAALEKIRPEDYRSFFEDPWPEPESPEYRELREGISENYLEDDVAYFTAKLASLEDLIAGDNRKRQYHLDEMSDLTLGERSYSVKSDIRARRCTAGKWNVHVHKNIRLLSSVPARCHRCDGCIADKRARHLAQLKAALKKWSRVEAAPKSSDAEYDAFTRKLRRWREASGDRLLHVYVPVGGEMRVVLTEANVGGEVIAPEDLDGYLEALVAEESTEIRARLDGCKGWDFREAASRKRKPAEWIRLSVAYGSVGAYVPIEAQIAAYQHWCKPMRTHAWGKRTVWDARHLSDDEYWALLWALGCREQFGRAA